MSPLRVVIEHAENYFAILGLVEEKECLPTLVLQERTFYRVKSTPRWVLYRGAISGYGDNQGRNFKPEQR